MKLPGLVLVEAKALNHMRFISRAPTTTATRRRIVRAIGRLRPRIIDWGCLVGHRAREPGDILVDTRAMAGETNRPEREKLCDKTRLVVDCVLALAAGHVLAKALLRLSS